MTCHDGKPESRCEKVSNTVEILTEGKQKDVTSGLWMIRIKCTKVVSYTVNT